MKAKEPIKKYRMLKPGEQIKKGDQWGNGGKWFYIVRGMAKYNPKIHWVIRREIKGRKK